MRHLEFALLKDNNIHLCSINNWILKTCNTGGAKSATLRSTEGERCKVTCCSRDYVHDKLTVIGVRPLGNGVCLNGSRDFDQAT